MRDHTAITTTFNGAEYLELEAGCDRDGARSLPQYVRFRCGLAAAMVSKRGNATVRRSPVQFALERRTVTITVDKADRAELDAASTAAGISLPQYIRTKCGCEVRNTSLPNTEERDHEEEDAWDRLRRLGVDPQAYFPPEE